jgi:hypothetical protein
MVISEERGNQIWIPHTARNSSLTDVISACQGIYHLELVNEFIS